MSMLDRGPFLQRHCQLHCKPLKHFCLYQLQSVQCIPGGWWRFSLLCHHSLSSHKQDKQILYVSEESDNSANSSQSWLFTWGSRLADPAQVKTTENQFGLTAAEGKKKKKKKDAQTVEQQRLFKLLQNETQKEAVVYDLPTSFWFMAVWPDPVPPDMAGSSHTVLGKKQPSRRTILLLPFPCAWPSQVC